MHLIPVPHTLPVSPPLSGDSETLYSGRPGPSPILYDGDVSDSSVVLHDGRPSSSILFDADVPPSDIGPLSSPSSMPHEPPKSHPGNVRHSRQQTMPSPFQASTERTSRMTLPLHATVLPAEQLAVAQQSVGGGSPAAPVLPLWEHDQSFGLAIQAVPRIHLLQIQQFLLAAITLAENQLEILVNFLGTTILCLRTPLQLLHPLIKLQELHPDRPTFYFRDPSFPEFLLDPKRSKSFCINESRLFTLLLERSLGIILRAHDNLELDNTVPDVPLSDSIDPKSSSNLKWRIYKLAVQNLFGLWLQADGDPNLIRQLESLDFSKIFKFQERYDSGVWQVYDSRTIRQLSHKSNGLIRVYRPGLFPFNLLFGKSDLEDESGSYPKYVVGYGEKQALLVPRKLFKRDIRYVLVPYL